MFSKIHSQFGTAGLSLSVVAIVLALGGAAYAANNSATASKAGKPGPRGKTGPAGPAGPQGTAGPTGPAGTNGTNGAPGEKGTAGANGKSVVASAAGGSCSKGGTKFEVEGSGKSEKVCNGETGFTETLPPGQTEKGDWSYWLPNPGYDLTGLVSAVASYNIPLAAEPEAADQHYVAPGEATPEGCEGNVNEPGAKPGNLCIFAGIAFGVVEEGGGIYIGGPAENTIGFNNTQPGTTGFLLYLSRPENEQAIRFDGAYAVTEAE